MAANLPQFAVILRAGFAPAEYSLLRRYAVRLMDEENPPNELLLLKCNSFEVAYGHFAQVSAQDPSDPEIYTELSIPMNFVLVVINGAEHPRYPIGFAPAP